jgi:hypothetical protein
VRDGREAAHVQAALGDQHLRGVALDAGDRAQQRDRRLVRREDLVDAGIEIGDRGIEGVDVREQLGDHDAVVLDHKTAGQRLAQLRDLGAHPRLGQLGQLVGVADARQQRLEHRARRL